MYLHFVGNISTIVDFLLFSKLAKHLLVHLKVSNKLKTISKSENHNCYILKKKYLALIHFSDTCQHLNLHFNYFLFLLNVLTQF